MKFERNWCEINGQRFLYVRPRANVFDEDWIGFFETELANYQQDVFLILVDVVGVEENISFQGFSRIAEILKGLNVRRARFAVLPSNEFYPLLKKLFEDLAISKELDLNVRLFEQRDAAEAWLVSQ